MSRRCGTAAPGQACPGASEASRPGPEEAPGQRVPEVRPEGGHQELRPFTGGGGEGSEASRKDRTRRDRCLETPPPPERQPHRPELRLSRRREGSHGKALGSRRQKYRPRACSPGTPAPAPPSGKPCPAAQLPPAAPGLGCLPGPPGPPAATRAVPGGLPRTRGAQPRARAASLPGWADSKLWISRTPPCPWARGLPTAAHEQDPSPRLLMDGTLITQKAARK